MRKEMPLPRTSTNGFRSSENQIAEPEMADGLDRHKDQATSGRIACAKTDTVLWLNAMIDRPRPWDLPQLDEYVEAVLQRMSVNRDVMSDQQGNPYYVVYAAGVERDGKLRLDLEADCSAIGMPTNTPITVTMDPESGPVAWLIDDTLITTTGRELSPEEAGDKLGMDPLLVAFGKWMGRGSSQGRASGR